MEYKGYIIEPDKTGYSPKNNKYWIFEVDGEKSVGFGETIEECKEAINEIILENK